MCLVILLLSASHFPWKLICGTSLWPFMKMLSFRENLLLLLLTCLRSLPVPDHFNLILGLKFFNYSNDMNSCFKKKCRRADFCDQNVSRPVPPRLALLRTKATFLVVHPLEAGVGIRLFMVDSSPEGLAFWDPSFMSRVFH